MKITFDEAIKEHRKMWNWIADETEATGKPVGKEDYFIEFTKEYPDIPQSFCWCCEYVCTHEYDGEFNTCRGCPVVWNDFERCFSTGSLYFQWGQSKNPEEKAELARMIANLPERSQIKNHE